MSMLEDRIIQSENCYLAREVSCIFSGQAIFCLRLVAKRICQVYQFLRRMYMRLTFSNSCTYTCPVFSSVYSYQRSYQRWLGKRINKKEIKFWAVLGSLGCREKKLPTVISKYATFWGGFFNFLLANFFLNFF